MADGGIFGFLGDGQARRRALDQFGQDMMYYIPRELRGPLGLLAEANPVVSMERAGTAATGLLGQGATPMQRLEYAGDMMSNMAGVVAAPAIGARYGMPAAQALQEGLLGASQSAGVPQFMADESGALRLFGPNDVERRGTQIMEMLRSGRGSDITDEMLDMGDPVSNTHLNEWLFKNYDLPMDAASRNARARDMGFAIDEKWFHGTSNKDFAFFDDDPMKQKLKDDIGVFAVNKPQVAETYGQTIIPLSVRPSEHTYNIDLADLRAAYERVPESERPWSGSFADWKGFYKPGSLQMRDDFAHIYSDAAMGGSDIRYSRVNDTLSGGRSGRHEMLQVPELERLRSRFARFDPRLSHLRNLSASVAGLAAFLGIPESDVAQSMGYATPQQDAVTGLLGPTRPPRAD